MKVLWPASRNVAVSGKDRAAVMMSGHHPDQRWYWDGKRFATDVAVAPAPQAVTRTNAVVQQLLAAPAEGLQPPPFCAGKAQPITLEGSGKMVGNGTLARAAGDAAAFRATPALDGSTLALAAGLVQEMKLGRGASPDLLSVSLSATDYVGHTYGPGGQEMCLQLLELDRELGDFFAFLDRTGIDYALALSADHGGLDIPERLRLHGVTDAARVDPALAAPVVGSAIGQKLGLSGPILIGEFSGDVWIDKSLTGIDRTRTLREALKAYRAHPQVEAAFSRRPNREHCHAKRQSGRLDADPAGPCILRSGALGRHHRVLKAAHHADRRYEILCFDAWQPVGLRPPRADPVLAAEHGSGCSAGRG